MEGAELEVLKTVDFSRLSVKVLMVELDGHNPEKDQAVTDLLAGAGFAPLKKTIKVGRWAGQRDVGSRGFRCPFSQVSCCARITVELPNCSPLFSPCSAYRMTCQN